MVNQKFLPLPPSTITDHRKSEGKIEPVMAKLEEVAMMMAITKLTNKFKNNPLRLLERPAKKVSTRGTPGCNQPSPKLMILVKIMMGAIILPNREIKIFS